MAKRVGMEGAAAAAEAARLARIDVVAAYPITPQSHIAERLAEMVADGELDAEFVCVESEHSAMSACMGASAVGARTFTATAGQGLELMHEVLYVVSAMRLPVVMAVVNRTLSAPLNIWGDHSDAMATRDCGWIQLFAENVQDVFDLVICAFRIGEDRRVLLPAMVHLDGFHLSHVVEPLFLLEQEQVDGFLPEYRSPLPLNPDRPVTMGAYGPPFIYTEVKKAQQVALAASKEVILEVWREFGDLSGRYYSPVETYRTEDAEVLLLTMGSFSGMAMMAVDNMREAGRKVGLVGLRLWRPFPFEGFRQAVEGAEVLVVLDRALSFGGPGGPVFSEVRSALYERGKPRVVGFVGGLGGRDIFPRDFELMVDRGLEITEKGSQEEFEMFGVRE